jgi:trimeric autotransporter adhesin
LFTTHAQITDELACKGLFDPFTVNRSPGLYTTVSADNGYTSATTSSSSSASKGVKASSSTNSTATVPTAAAVKPGTVASSSSEHVTALHKAFGALLEHTTADALVAARVRRAVTSVLAAAPATKDNDDDDYVTTDADTTTAAAAKPTVAAAAVITSTAAAAAAAMSATAQTAAVRSALCLIRLSSSGLTAAELIGLLRRLRRARTQLPAARFAAASEYTGTKRKQANTTAAATASATGADAEIQFVAPAFTSEDWLVLEAQLKPFVLCVLGRYRLRGRAQAAAVDLLLVDSEAVSDSNMRLAAYSGTTATAATAAATAAVVNSHNSVYTSSPRVFYLQELQWYFEQQAPSRRRSEELPHALHALIAIHSEAAGTGSSSNIATYSTAAVPAGTTAAATVAVTSATSVVAAAAAAATAVAVMAVQSNNNSNSSSSSAAAHRARLCRDALLSAVTAVPTFTLLADEQQGDVAALARHFAACQTSSEAALAKLRHSFERRYAVEPPPLVDTRITLVSAASATAAAAADGTAAATAAATATAVVPQVTYHLLTAGDTPLLKELHSEGSAVLLSIAVFAHSHLGLTAAAQCLAESAVCMMLGVRSLSSKELSRIAHVHTPALQLLRGLDFLARCYLAHAVAMHELIVGEHPQQQQGLYCGTLQTEPEQSELVQRRHEAAAAAAAAALAAVREEELSASGQQLEQQQQQQSSTLQHKRQLKAAVRAVDFASKLKAAAALARSNTAASVASADDAQAAAVAQQQQQLISNAKRRRAVPKHVASGAANTNAATATDTAGATKQQQQNTIQAVAAALLKAAVPGGQVLSTLVV